MSLLGLNGPVEGRHCFTVGEAFERARIQRAYQFTPSGGLIGPGAVMSPADTPSIRNLFP